MAVKTKTELEALITALSALMTLNFASGTNITAAELREYLTSTQSFFSDIVDTIFAIAGVDYSQVTLATTVYQNDEFIGLTISEIKQRFRIYFDGTELVTRDGTTLTSSVTGTIDFGYAYTGTAYLLDFKTELS